MGRGLHCYDIGQKGPGRSGTGIVGHSVELCKGGDQSWKGGRVREGT